ncbi:hypothetical protein [Nonomuraea recticatena]|uniref:Holin n=1 Tax=Nonomuraea recticatena TaxID=46178 RepID=A0ABP6EFH2_9ACTN
MVHNADSGMASDALVRAWRTFGQGAAVAALVSVGTVLTTLGSEPDWKGVLVSCGQAVLTAVVTYAHNKVRPAL